ncbi:pyridoxal phosphate-dependent aminotransferase [Cognatazoarcus halotolerans]|uniref:pyridoxal phosphate-dependent aminotransferase n=1 Tax=Cognatazoarcus halotolerans TaxID=2686016 RepID=UPI00135C883E|nr:pyridoxal phosphate-dependent aminotransferase [Cognatazoarcus halotolerans]MBX3679878.1 pyridoxal phosphate-dependent aminotransferase [Rhodocyclaceae bacterium]MCB1899054.1 pyridoxal phosphate-dependent aminotransferase [Rhodocyclaceae bacterium]MCP5308072.1 pyridoxal phosphate-dependent aminotransferase [Zoogloeaceae bacterium]
MPTFPAAIRSRLPNVGTTIFTVMSQMAHDAGAINLSQGFPDFQAEDALFERVAHWMRAGANQYAPMAGVPSLREAIVAKVEALYGARYDVADEVTVVAGATQGLFTAIAAMVSPGDEVIVFEPVYDSYVPAIELQGGVVVRAVLGAPDYRPDWAQVAALVTPRTRMIMINTPHNPTATVWTSEDMRALEALLRGTDIVVVADEVYEHIVFDGRRHESVMRYPGLAERSFVVSSFGKTYHVTGWKVGYVLAPRALMSEFRKVHQFNVFTVATPLQFALADYMGDASRYLGLPAFYQDKRDRFAALMRASRFELLPSAGTYFQLAAYRQISDQPDTDFTRYLIREAGVAAIPVSAFYADRRDDRVIRFCFAKNAETLVAAAERLVRL